MPSTYHSEIALQRRKDKQEFAAHFPGLLTADAAVGKTVARVLTVGHYQLLIFTGGGFLVTGSSHLTTEEWLALLDAAREALEPLHAEAYAELDRRIALEAEAMRLARMEKVLGAVENNLPQIPELREELRRLLEED
jgi:hypothetical protein